MNALRYTDAEIQGLLLQSIANHMLSLGQNSVPEEGGIVHLQLFFRLCSVGKMIRTRHSITVTIIHIRKTHN